MKQIIILTVLLLTACSEDKLNNYAPPVQQYQQQPIQQVAPPVQYVPQQAPVVIQQPHSDSGSALTNMMIGGLVGHTIANATRSAPVAQRPITINKTYNISKPRTVRRK